MTSIRRLECSKSKAHSHRKPMRFFGMVFIADVYHKALHEAWIKSATSLAKAAVPLPPNSDYFISHFYPPRMGLSGTVEFIV